MKTKLKSHHAIWIIEAAAKAFEEKARAAELDLLRHGHFANEPNVRGNLVLSSDRQEESERTRRFLEQYRDILTYLAWSLDVIQKQSAQEWAREFVQTFGKKKL